MRDASPESVYFRGRDFKVGPWTPDGVRVDLENVVSPPQCSLVLIELEPSEPMALRSSRKYLHENSVDICAGFIQYLDRVIEDCDSRADPRETKIAFLRHALAQNPPVTVKTAAALRSSTTFLEETPLTDQTSSVRAHETPHYNVSAEQRAGREQQVLRGILKLDGEESKALRRCVMILDAVIQQRDHTGANFHSWRLKAPLKNQLTRMIEKSPTLERFILHQQNSGITIDLEALLSELIELWAKDGKQIDLEVARKLAEDYLPTARKIRPHDKMKLIFESANLQAGRLIEDRPQ